MTSLRPILLVDDNPDDVALTLRAFRKVGLTTEVIVANNGMEAFGRLYGTSTSVPLQPAIILLDLNMPVVNGHEVLTRIRGEPSTRTLPVIILTSSTELADLSRAYDGGANSYLKKPVVFAEFVETVRQIADYWLSLNQPPPAR